MALLEAKLQGLEPPRTKEDVERLTGYAYNGPDPAVIGKTYEVRVHKPLTR